MFTRTNIFRASLLFALALTCAATTRAQNISVDMANMRQELEMLRQRVGQLELNVESLQRENSELRSAASTGKQSYATVNQLNDAIADINRAIKDSNASTKADTLRQVSKQLDKLAADTNTALDQMAKSVNSSRRTVSTTPATSGGNTTTTATAPTFSDNYSKDGISYTVVSGDNLSLIAKKTSSKVEDIKNANRIANDKKLMIGQVLFIPGGKDPNSPVSPAGH